MIKLVRVVDQVAGSQLVRYDAMCRAIDAAFQVDEVKDIRDKAMAWVIYSKQAKNYDAERKAAQIRIRAERRLGELIKGQKETGGINRGAAGLGSNQHQVRFREGTAPPTLAELGIDKKLSMHAQKLADIPQDQFETILASEPKPTTEGVISAAQRSGKAGGSHEPAKRTSTKLKHLLALLSTKQQNNDEIEIVVAELSGWLAAVAKPRLYALVAAIAHRAAELEQASRIIVNAPSFYWAIEVEKEIPACDLKDLAGLPINRLLSDARAVRDTIDQLITGLELRAETDQPTATGVLSPAAIGE